MIKPNLVILYVDSLQKSAQFYSELLNATPVESSETFVMFAFGNGLQLGLWSKNTVSPSCDSIADGMEVAFIVESLEQLEGYYKKSVVQQHHITQDIAQMSFGQSFMLKDPDGHRLRFYKLERG